MAGRSDYRNAFVAVGCKALPNYDVDGWAAFDTPKKAGAQWAETWGVNDKGEVIRGEQEGGRLKVYLGSALKTPQQLCVLYGLDYTLWTKYLASKSPPSAVTGNPIAGLFSNVVSTIGKTLDNIIDPTNETSPGTTVKPTDQVPTDIGGDESARAPDTGVQSTMPWPLIAFATTGITGAIFAAWMIVTDKSAPKQRRSRRW